MRVECWFDDETTLIRNMNKLRISSVNDYTNYVKVAILDDNGATMVQETVVDGMELMKAIQNAMNT